MNDRAASMVTSALYNLKATLDSQFRMQQETNELLRTLIRTLQQTGQATADLAAAMVEDE